MRKFQSWLGVGAGGRKSHTRPESAQKRDRRIRKAVGRGDRKRVKDTFGTVSYPEPTADQIEKAGL